MFLVLKSNQLGLYDRPTASLQRGNTPIPMSVLDMTLNKSDGKALVLGLRRM